LVSKEIIENIDLEQGKIRIGGRWFTEDEIRYAIKMKVSSDDYNVADLAVALQTLINEMNKSTTLRVRVPKEMAEKFDELSRERGESVEAMLRDILIEYINRESEYAEKLEEEGVSDEGILGGENDEIDIMEDETEDKLLDIDAAANEPEIVEVETEEVLEAEELPDIEDDEEIIEPEIEEEEEEYITEVDVLDEKLGNPEIEEDLNIEDLDDIEAIVEEISEPDIEEDFDTAPMSELAAIDEGIVEAEDRKIKRNLKKKKATKKKIILRKKKMRNKAYK
jgi:predicted transcriptional regulator